DSNLRPATFSNFSSGLEGGGIDLAAPGVAVFSSWSRTAKSNPGTYRSIAGTSMAAPHVTGLAALICESRPSYAASDVWRALLSLCRTLQLPVTRVGKGLARAPRNDR